MKLDIQSIRQKALEIYLKASRDTRIPEDFYASLYEEFIKRMEKLKLRYPEKNDVPEAYTVMVVKFIIKDLYRKQRNQENLENNIEIIEQGLYGTREALDREGEGPVLNRIRSVINSSIKAGGTYAQYSFFFLLYFSAYIPQAFIEEKGLELGYDSGTTEKWVSLIREKVISRYSDRIETNEKTLCACFNRILKLQRKYKQDGQITKQEYLNEYNKLAIKRCNAIEKHMELLMVPPYNLAAEIIGVNGDTMRYGVKAILDKLSSKRRVAVRIYRRAV
ncbi:MAG: hypothetical protein JXR70_02955 [Spirochaetales bacterium]|nr:hypothetical protein [Spirochaetales bacterium]